MATQLGYALSLVHQVDFSQTELFAFGQVLGRFVRQVRLAECAFDCLVYHLQAPINHFHAEQMRRDAHTREWRAAKGRRIYGHYAAISAPKGVSAPGTHSKSFESVA